MAKTREKILLTGRSLFNQHGVSNVTIRQIAMELGISSGNLNYHFKKKEEIIEAIYFEMVAVFDERVETLDEDLFTLPYVHSEMKRSMLRMVDYRFIWIDLYHLLRTFPKINTHFIAVWNKRKAGSLMLYQRLIEENLSLLFGLLFPYLTEEGEKRFWAL